jgi:uncharacterized membrane protein YdjX (TVP38/TMEM64 family)
MNGRLRVAVAILLAVLVVAGTLATQFPFVDAWIDRLSGLAQQLGPYGYTLFILLAVLVAIFGVIPASLMAIAAGVAYGLWLGFVLAAFGTMVGGWVAFRLSRSMLRPWIERLLGSHAKLARLDDALSEGGWRLVCLLRMSPVMPFAATSYSLGLTRLDQRSFLIGTLASLPALFGYVAVGALGNVGLAMHAHRVGWLHAATLTVGIVATVLAALHLRRLMKRNLHGTSALDAVTI